MRDVLHKDVMDKVYTILALLREIREMADGLPERHVRANRIKTACFKIEDEVSKKLMHHIWVHGKQHRRASGL